MALTAAQRTIYETRLAEAENALHQLTIGGMARTFVDQNGERVEFTVANAARLRGYIYELKMALGTISVAGPMKVSMVR